MTAARQGAEKAQAARLPVFEEAVAQSRAGDAALRERSLRVGRA